MTKIRPLPAAILLSLTWEGNAGSLIPVMGFFSKYGALAANWGLGFSSSSVKPIQSHWWAKLAFFLFQYSRKVTAEMNYLALDSNNECFYLTPKWHEDSIEDSPWIIKKVSYSCVRTYVMKLPSSAFFTQWTHTQTYLRNGINIHFFTWKFILSNLVSTYFCSYWILIKSDNSIEKYSQTYNCSW